MKIIKRDGRIVDYDRQKIIIAIEKANKEVTGKEKATKADIKSIINYVEELNKKRMLVEDVQDIIEKKLMEMGKYELAKKYIVYRYTRALVRKANTTDETILGLIRNTNIESSRDNTYSSMLASTQRDCIAGEVSKDLTNRLLLPEKIVEAHEEGILHFHDAEYFVQPIFNCCIVNMADMLDNGTVMNEKMIETPKSFQVACTVMTQIIASICSNQYGGQTINISCLGKYLKKSSEKYKEQLHDRFGGKITEKTINELVKDKVMAELRAGVQTIQYQINTLVTTSGQAPFVTLFLHIDDNDEYIEENALIIEEILKQRLEGIKNQRGLYITPTFPKLVYVLDENNCLKGGKYDYLTKLAIKCAAKRVYPDFLSAKKMRERYEGNVYGPMGGRNFLSTWKDKDGNYKFEGRFNQGVVSINLPQIGIISECDEDKFWKLLDERLELCKDALMCRHYALLGTKSDISPIHWQYGGIARLEKGEKIDKYLYNGYSTISLGYIGIYEVTKLMKGVSHIEPEGHDFALKIMQVMNEKIKKWKKETNLGFSLYATPAKKLAFRFAQLDKEQFGTIKDITDKGYYTNSYHVQEQSDLGLYERLEFEAEFEKFSNGGCISYLEVPNTRYDLNEIEKAVKFVYDNVQYAEFSDERSFP